jgi:hypothetical protein
MRQREFLKCLLIFFSSYNGFMFRDRSSITLSPFQNISCLNKILYQIINHFTLLMKYLMLVLHSPLFHLYHPPYL